MQKRFPETLLYTKDHEWCAIDGDVATLGITWHAQDQLGDIVYCELPEVGATLAQGQAFGVVESVKAVSDLYAPLSGEVLERNEAVLSTPDQLNRDMYEAGWLLKIRVANTSELSTLLEQNAYVKLVDELAH